MSLRKQSGFTTLESLVVLLVVAVVGLGGYRLWHDHQKSQKGPNQPTPTIAYNCHAQVQDTLIISERGTFVAYNSAKKYITYTNTSGKTVSASWCSLPEVQNAGGQKISLADLKPGQTILLGIAADGVALIQVQ